MNPSKRRIPVNLRRSKDNSKQTKSQPKLTNLKNTTKKKTFPAPKKRAPLIKNLTTQVNLPGVRLNKYLAEKHVASRREADSLISEGKITINGRIANIGDRVLPEDIVLLVGTTKQKRYLAYYKGRGIISHSPTLNEVDILTRIRQDFGITDVAPVGRLDKDSEGLIILTNDGRITGPLLDPEKTHEKEYQVTVDKKITPAFCRLLELGVSIEGYKTKPATVIPSPKNEQRFNITLTEGKKHQIRRMCAALGYQVIALKRVRIMNIMLENLKPNQYRKIADKELKQLLNDLDIV